MQKDISWTMFCLAIAGIALTAFITLVCKAPTVRFLVPAMGIILLAYLSYAYFSNLNRVKQSSEEDDKV